MMRLTGGISGKGNNLRSRILTNPLAWFVAGVLAAALALQFGVVQAATPYEQWRAEAARNGDAIDLASYNQHVIRLTWPDHLEAWAIKVARCESTLNAEAVNWAGPYIGLFQIWVGHGYSTSSLMDPIYNSEQAYLLYLRQGAQAWPYCQYR